MKKYFIAMMAAMLLSLPTWVRGGRRRGGGGGVGGKKVKQGKYRVMVNTLYQASDIIYSGTFSTNDKTGNVTLTSKLTEPKESHQGMITDVKAILK